MISLLYFYAIPCLSQLIRSQMAIEIYIKIYIIVIQYHFWSFCMFIKLLGKIKDALKFSFLSHGDVALWTTNAFFFKKKTTIKSSMHPRGEFLFVHGPIWFVFLWYVAYDILDFFLWPHSSFNVRVRDIQMDMMRSLFITSNHVWTWCSIDINEILLLFISRFLCKCHHLHFFINKNLIIFLNIWQFSIDCM